MLFGAAADRAGTRETVLPVEEEVALGDLWPVLAGRYPKLAEMQHNLAFAVNGEYARMEDRVSSGDEVAVLPPVSGG